MRRRVTASALWGLVAALGFLVLAQGYRLAVGRGVGFVAMVGVAGAVGVVAAVLAYVAEGRLTRKERV